jgi:hypothetical protein
VQKSKAAKLLAAQSSSKSKGKKKKWSKGKLREKKVRQPDAINSQPQRSGSAATNRQRPQQGLQATGAFLSGLAGTAAERTTVLHADGGVGADRERIAAACGCVPFVVAGSPSLLLHRCIPPALATAAARLRSASPWR